MTAKKTVIDLGGCWRLEGFGADDRSPIGPIEGSVPGHVHTDLLRASIIKDPFWREQAHDCQWIEHCTWHYTRTFDLKEDQLSDWMVLRFEGLDTYAEVLLNGIAVGKTDNMFIPHEMEVSGVVRQGTNTLEVRFTPIAEAIAGQPVGKYVSLFSPERVFVRRMQCGFGWDWVHRFVSAGIWRPVRLTTYHGARITDVFVHTHSISGPGVELAVEGEVENRTGAPLQVFLEFFGPDGGLWHPPPLEVEDGPFAVAFTLTQASLWWPNGMGEQPLYRCRCTLQTPSGQLLDKRSVSFGIRTISLEETPDEQGQSCILKINGVPVFAKGANWVPADPFPGTIPDQHYERLLMLARQGHVNMLRVWGGGIYESPAFYEACDRLGILVMQDFMLACAWYPEEDAAFMNALKEEFEAVIRQLRNHPSLAVWCGDNELGMNEPEDSPYNGRAIADGVSGPLCAALDPSRPFRKTSPYGGTPNNAADRGDCHISSWLNREFQLSDMTDYRERIRDLWGRFVSEYVTLGMPCIETQRRYASEEDLHDPEGRVLAFHNKDNPYNGIDHADHFGMMRQTAVNLYGDSPDPLVLLSRMEYEQYEWIRLSCESLRRRKFDCAGLLFWMYNDCWPANGCSIVDYYGVPKAAWYAMKSGFKPVIACLEPCDEEVRVWLSNDTREPVEVTVSLYFQPFAGTVRRERKIIVTLPANAAQSVARIARTELDSDGVLVCDVTTPEDTDRALYFPGMPRDMALPDACVEAAFDTPDNPKTLTLKTDVYARVVTIHGGIIASDNYFDMRPGEERTISITYPVKSNRKDIQVTWWNRRTS